jgi:MOSC domain-containing protein YiiM
MKRTPHVRALFLAPKARGPMVLKRRVTAIAGRGLEGDRYAEGKGSWNKGKPGKRQVTFINARFFNNTLFDYAKSRRNIVTADFELSNFMCGREFRIANAVFRGVGYCYPCDIPGTNFKEEFFDCGGLIAEVVKGGTIWEFDSIQDNFWTKVERDTLLTAKNLEDLVRVALIILERMHRTGRRIIQVCAPMTTGGLGNYEANMEVFRRIIENAHQSSRYLVFDQDSFTDAILRLDGKRDNKHEYWHKLIDEFYGAIFRSGYFYGTVWVRGWRGSVGCRGERRIARECGLVKMPCPKDWYNK